jgi:hypothetical protein
MIRTQLGMHSRSEMVAVCGTPFVIPPRNRNSNTHSVKIFKIQKNIIRIITGCRSRDSCRDVFKKLKILPLQSQYILSLLLFVVYNKNKF